MLIPYPPPAKSKGLVTQAFGSIYCAMAEHLLQSYRLYGNCDYPFYVITDSAGAKRLGKLFDGVIIHDDFSRSTVDKMWAFTDTPFDETLFIDADSSVVKDIKRVFTLFEENGSAVSAIAGCTSLNKNHGIQFGPTAIEAFEIHHDFPNFNGGVYYYDKSSEGKKCVDFMMNELKPNYKLYGLLESDDSTGMYDEPLVIVGMLKFGFRPIPQTTDVMYLVHDGREVKWDMKDRNCSYHYYDKLVSPTIIHWKFGGTETHNYKCYDALLRHKFFKTSRCSYILERFKLFCKYRVYARMTWLHPLIAKIR